MPNRRTTGGFPNLDVNYPSADLGFSTLAGMVLSGQNTKQVDATFSTRINLQKPNTYFLERILDEAPLRLVPNSEFNYYFDITKPDIMKITTAAVVGATAIVLDKISNITPNTHLWLPSTGEYLAVTAVNTATKTLTVVRGQRSSTAKAIPANTDIVPLGQVRVEGGGSHISGARKAEKVQTFVQRFVTKKSVTYDQLEAMDRDRQKVENKNRPQSVASQLAFTHANSLESASLFSIGSDAILSAANVADTGIYSGEQEGATVYTCDGLEGALMKGSGNKTTLTATDKLTYEKLRDIVQSSTEYAIDGVAANERVLIGSTKAINLIDDMLLNIGQVYFKETIHIYGLAFNKLELRNGITLYLKDHYMLNAYPGVQDIAYMLPMNGIGRLYSPFPALATGREGTQMLGKDTLFQKIDRGLVDGQHRFEFILSTNRGYEWQNIPMLRKISGIKAANVKTS